MEIVEGGWWKVEIVEGGWWHVGKSERRMVAEGDRGIMILNT